MGYFGAFSAAFIVFCCSPLPNGGYLRMDAENLGLKMGVYESGGQGWALSRFSELVIQLVIQLVIHFCCFSDTSFAVLGQKRNTVFEFCDRLVHEFRVWRFGV